MLKMIIDNIPIAILKMLFACTFIMCYYPDVGAIFLMLTTLILEYKDCHITYINV